MSLYDLGSVLIADARTRATWTASLAVPSCIWCRQLVPSATKLWTKDSGLYAYPFSTSPFGMFYNKNLLTQAGVRLPAPNGEKIREFAGKTSGRLIDVSAFKDLAGVSRKYAIPLLEYFDRTKVTARSGDKRVVL